MCNVLSGLGGTVAPLRFISLLRGGRSGCAECNIIYRSGRLSSCLDGLSMTS